MNDLTEFLLARIAEDEAAARATTPVPDGRWIVTRDKHDTDDARPSLVTGRHPTEGDVYADDPEGYRYGSEIIAHPAEWQEEAEANGRHIARWDPARVLAECEAKRRIIAELGPPYWKAGGSSVPYDAALRALALPYIDHPDYREEWRP